MKISKTLRNQRGFSLVEILIVITLVALGGTFVVNQLVARLGEGNVKGATIQIQSFKALLEDYRRYCNQYPTTEQGLEALIAKSDKSPDCPNYPAAGFLSSTKLPVDGWGNPFIYESTGTAFTITSLGNDGKEGGTDVNADIKSTDL